MSIPRLPESRRGALALAAAALLAFSPNGRTDDEAARRARIANDRAAIERTAQAREAQCASRFAVTDCVDRARAERRVASERLDRELGVRDADQRRRRAAARLEQVERTTPASEPAAAAARVPVTRERRTPLGDAPAPSAGATQTTDSASEATRAAARSQASARAANQAVSRATAAAQRASAAQAHRETVERRNAQWRKSHKPSRPLPVPTAASGAPR